MKIKIIPLLLGALTLTIVGCNKQEGSSSYSSSSEESTFSISSEPTSEDVLSNVKEIKSNNLNRSEEPLIKWEGRYEYKIGDANVPNMMYLYHTATGFTVDFYGTSLEVEFYKSSTAGGTSGGGDIYYDYAIDNETLPNVSNRRFKIPTANYRYTATLCSGLQEGHHRVKCLKMDEPADAYTAVISMTTDGAFYIRNQEKDNENLKIMAVCASGGSGYGSLSYNERSKTAATRTRKNSSSLHAFNYLTARRYNADIHFVAQAGWGVKYSTNKSILDVIDKCGITPSNDVAGALTTGDWNYQNYIPDIILFNIGGNDTTKDEFNVDIYKQGVLDLVGKMHGYYPNAKMIWTHTGSKAGSYAIDALQSAGIVSQGYLKQGIIPNVGEGKTGEGTYGASSHASFKTHLDIEAILVDILSRWGFTPTVDDVSFADFNFMIERA